MFVLCHYNVIYYVVFIVIVHIVIVYYSNVCIVVYVLYNARKNIYANYWRLNYKSITNQSVQSNDIGHACISLCETFKSINIQCVQ